LFCVARATMVNKDEYTM